MCPFCGTGNGCLIGWGFYGRWAITAAEELWIYIKVWKCKNQVSGGYVSVLPTFLLPGRQYTFNTVYQVLKARILDGLSLAGSLSRVFGNRTHPTYQTVQHWLKTVGQCGLWIGILQGENRKEVARPEKIDDTRIAEEIVHLMLVLEECFGTCEDELQMANRHADLLNRYRGSPFCRLAS